MTNGRCDMVFEARQVLVRDVARLFSCFDHFARPSIVLSFSVEDFVPREAHSDLQKMKGLENWFNFVFASLAWFIKSNLEWID